MLLKLSAASPNEKKTSTKPCGSCSAYFYSFNDLGWLFEFPIQSSPLGGLAKTSKHRI